MDKFNEIIDDIVFVQENSLDEFLNQEEFTEGANLEFTKEFKEMKKEVKETIKKAKELQKKGKLKEAEEEIDKVIKKLEELKTWLIEYDDTFGETLSGIVMQSVLSWLKTIGVGIITFGFGGFIVKIKDLIDIITGFIEQLENDYDVGVKTFNMRKNKLIALVNEMIKILNRTKKEITRNSEFKKESSIEEIKFEIYESERNGDITKEQMTLLLEMVSA